MSKDQIHIENYEAWLLDYAEVTLSKGKIEQLFAFMENHPEFKDDYEMVFELDFLDRILPDENQTLDSSIKSNLKVTPKGKINSSNVEDFIISDLEGLLTNEEKSELSSFLAANPMAKKDQKLFEKTILQPELDVIYPNKESLKKAAPVFFLSNANYSRFAVAASILLLIGFFVFNNSPKTEKLKVAEVKSELSQNNDSISKPLESGNKIQDEKDVEKNKKSDLPKENIEVNPKKEKVENNGQSDPSRSRIIKLKIKENPSQLFFNFENQQIAFVDIKPEVIPNTDYFMGEELAQVEPKSNGFKTINEVLGNEIDKRVFNTEETPKEGRLVAAANKVLGKLFDSEIVVTHDTISNKNELSAFHSPIFDLERNK